MKQLNITILLTMLMSMVGVGAFAYDACIDGIYYNFSESGAMVVSGSSPYSDDVIIPKTVIYKGKTYNVISIADYAFNGNNGLTSVTISNGVTSIGKYAFEGCSNIISVSIPESVTSIGHNAFYNCSALSSIDIPNSVTSIGESSFTGTSWYENQPDGLVYAGKVAYEYKGIMPENTSIVLNDGTVSVSSFAFLGRSSLISITIPESVTNIDFKAFQNCSGLTSITIPNSVINIGKSAFSGCSGITSMIVLSGNTKYDSRDNCNAIIETASNTLIAGCKNTTIPNSVASIGVCAFLDCSGLTSITIPNSVTNIGQDAFFGTAWYENQPDGLVYAGKVAYMYKGTMPENTSIVLNDGTVSISALAFANRTGLTSITIPESVTSISSYAFQNCSSLISVAIPNSVTTIGRMAFSWCSALSSIIVLPGNTKYDSRDNCNAVIETASNTLSFPDFG